MRTEILTMIPIKKHKFIDPIVLVSVVVIVTASAVIAGIAKDYFNPVDYFAWRKDWQLLSECLNAVTTRQCGGISQFPLAYMLNSLWSADNPRNLALINLFILLLPVLFLGFIRGWRIAGVAGSIYMVALTFSPLPAFYVYSGALEVQSGVVSGVFVASLAMIAFSCGEARPKVLPVLLAISGLLLPLYKDTLPLVIVVSFILMLALHVLTARRSSVCKPSRQTIWLLLKAGVLPFVIGLLISAGYNLLKFGVPWSVVYLNAANTASPVQTKSLEFLLGSVFSPNGGVVVFWFLPFFLVIIGYHILGLAPRNSVVWLGAIVAACSCLGFALWWAPFGWDGWGNRLMVQPMLALMVAMLLSVEQSPFQRPSVVGLLRIVLLCLPMLFWSGYYVATPFLADDRGKLVSASLWSGPACRDMQLAMRQEKPVGLEFWKSEIYYRCARERMLYVPSP